MTAETKNVCIVLEALASTADKELENAVKDLKESIQKFCGGTISTHILNKENPETEL